MSKHFTFTRMPFGISTQTDAMKQFLKDAGFLYKLEEDILNADNTNNEERKIPSQLDILKSLTTVSKWRTYRDQLKQEKNDYAKQMNEELFLRKILWKISNTARRLKKKENCIFINFKIAKHFNLY